MPFNPSGAVDAALEVFGGWVTEMSPINVPAGVSPDCPECAFYPGSVFTRSAFQKVFNPPLAAGQTINYGKSFVSPIGTIYNLYLSSGGTLYLENVTESPGTATALFTTFSNLYARSITAFGREYIALSDGFHGADIPLQFDGTNLDRVTQDGPGAPPTVTSIALPSVNMSNAGGTSLQRANNRVLCATASPHGLQVGYQAQISNVPGSNPGTQSSVSNSTLQSTDPTWWELDSGQWRCTGYATGGHGNSPLAAFVAEGFDFFIPGSATIVGITTNLTVLSQAATTGTIAEVSLWSAGAPIGTPKMPATPITTTPTLETYGSSGDLWGAALNPATVNNPGFGFAISCSFDSVRIFFNFPFTVTVFYTIDGSTTIAAVSSITINNELIAGEALVTTVAPHGLIPNIDVTITGVQPATISNITGAEWSSGTTTLTTENSHNLSPGALIQVSDVTTSTVGTTFSFNGTFTVVGVPNPNQVTYVQTPVNSSDPDVIDATANTGSVTLAWPISDVTPTPTYFTVVSCPTPTTFYIQVNYQDATWSGSGSVGFGWEGIFYVTAIPDSTHFYYQQYGPDASTTAEGVVTPFGQAAPGIHRVRQSFLTRQGYLTKPSPWVQFIANGGQYLQVTNLAIGPQNIVARVLEFTGALGSLFYYLPVPAQVNGIFVSTATQINDNTTTSVILDFSDNTLYEGIGTSIPGNNTPAQIVLDGALGFSTFDNYNATFGQRNRVNAFLNMGFAGGSQPSNINLPTGWSVSGSGYSLQPARGGVETGFQMTAACTISQDAFEDINGDPILTQNTNYTFRAWISASAGLAVTASFTSVSTGYSSTATIVTNNGPQFYEQPFSLITPTPIPEDMVFSIAFSGGGTILINNCSVIFTDTPYTNSIVNVSYTNNPEAFDGITGQTGPSTDPNQVVDLNVLNDIPYLLTREPSGRLHEISNTATALPSGWVVSERASNCGALSAFAVTQSQADDNSSSGGEEWFAWASESGARIFGGNQVWKISQEIQPNWSGGENPAAQINMAAAATIWAMNDPVERTIYFGLPIGSATSPTAIYAMNYRELDSAESIAFSPPYRTSFSGKLIATDNTRKWAPWYRPMNGAARMFRTTTGLTPVFFAGNSTTPFGNVYVLNPAQYTDDDFGQIYSYYTTCALPTREMEIGMQLGGARKMLCYLSGYIQSISNVTITPYPANLDNPWPLTCTRTPGMNPSFDLEWTAGNLEAYRVFFRVQPSPLAGETDSNFELQRLIPWFRKSRIPVRGSAF